MRIIFLFLLSIASSICIGQTDISTNFKKLDWLIGTWNRTNITKPGRTAHEVWQKISENKLGGFGVVLQNQDTVFVEKFDLRIKDNTIYYVADVPENKEPVFFKVTDLTTNSFVCENPEHDFPKRITYQWDGAILRAQISGNGKSTDFLFQRK